MIFFSYSLSLTTQFIWVDYNFEIQTLCFLRLQNGQLLAPTWMLFHFDWVLQPQLLGWLKVNTTRIAQIVEKLKHVHGSQSRTKLYIFTHWFIVSFLSRKRYDLELRLVPYKSQLFHSSMCTLTSPMIPSPLSPDLKTMAWLSLEKPYCHNPP